LTSQFSQARTHYSQCLALHQARDHRQGVAQAMEAFARLAAAQQQATRAASLFGSAEALGEQAGVSVPAEEKNHHDDCVGLVRAALGDEAFFAHWSAGRALTPEQAVTYALSSAEGGPS
jgi:non-specific serine/threonine protein kinase